MKIRPLGDRILVKRIKEKDKTKGGIIIPDTAKEKPQEGRVVAVGKGKMTEAGKLLVPDVKAGDRILFTKYSGSEVKLEAEEHLTPARGRHLRRARGVTGRHGSQSLRNIFSELRRGKELCPQRWSVFPRKRARRF